MINYSKIIKESINKVLNEETLKPGQTFRLPFTGLKALKLLQQKYGCPPTDFYYDQNNPGWTLHLVAEFTPNDSTETNAIIIANNGSSSQGLTVYSSGSYCYCKIKTQAYDTNGSKFKAWSTYSPTGRDTNYYKTRNEITFDITYSTDKKFTLTVNNKATDYVNYSYDMTLNGITIMVGKGISNFTIKEFSVVKI